MTNNESVGLLPLWEPKISAEATVDIVFVHGLGGDREKTWTYTRDRRPSIFWPKELLPEKCPKARILTFGYNAQFIHFYFSKKRVPVGTKVDNHSSALLQILANLRSNTQTTERPIIFVAHSLGGLVIANGLSRPDQMDAATKSVVDHTYGTIFLGTPFEGSTKANPGETVLRTLKWLNISTNTDDVKELKKQSERIAEIREEFLTAVRSRDQAGKQIHIACFFETEPTHIVKDKKWVSIGVIVEKESATLPTVKPVGIHGDHEEICKFGGDWDGGYQTVSGLLARWIEDMANPNQPKKASPSISITGDVVYRDNNNYGGTFTGHNAGTYERAVEVTGGKENTYNFDGTRPQKDRLGGGERY